MLKKKTGQVGSVSPFWWAPPVWERTAQEGLGLLLSAYGNGVTGSVQPP